MFPEEEINVLNDVYETVKGLENSQIKRILEWITNKFGLDVTEESGTDQLEIIPLSPHESLPAPGMLDSSIPGSEILEEKHGYKSQKEQPVVEDILPQTVTENKRDFFKFDSFEDLYTSSNVRTITAKILLAAAYLQENKKLKEFGSSDINALLKKIGLRVPNISASINILMKKMPPLLIHKGKAGTSKQARRAYGVSNEGLRIARNYINE